MASRLALLTQIEGRSGARVGILLAVGLVLWVLNWLVVAPPGIRHRLTRFASVRLREPISIGRVRRPLFVLVASVVLIDTMFFAAITPLLPDYADELELSKTAAGILSASYAAGHAARHLPGRVLAARVGMRQTVLAGMLLMAGSGLAFAFADRTSCCWTAARFLQGVGGSFAWIGGLSWLVSETPADRRGEVIGSALAAAIFGDPHGPGDSGALATVTGPEPVFASAAVFGSAWPSGRYLTPSPGRLRSRAGRGCDGRSPALPWRRASGW